MFIDPITKHLVIREGRNNSRKPVILMYHGTTSGSGRPADKYSVNSHRFSQQLDFLQEFGWKTLCVKDLIKSEPLPPKSILITFDDGYRNNFTNAFLPLVERGMCATWYIVSNCIGKYAQWLGPVTPETKMLDIMQLREMAAAGMEIGSHTSTHPDLTAVSADMMRREIHRSREELEDIFGNDITSFAYPFGRYNYEAVNSVKNAGYLLACGVRPGLVNTHLEPYLLRRVTVFADDSLGTFARKLAFVTNNASLRTMLRYAGNRMADRLGL